MPSKYGFETEDDRRMKRQQDEMEREERARRNAIITKQLRQRREIAANGIDQILRDIVVDFVYSRNKKSTNLRLDHDDTRSVWWVGGCDFRIEMVDGYEYHLNRPTELHHELRVVECAKRGDRSMFSSLIGVIQEQTKLPTSYRQEDPPEPRYEANSRDDYIKPGDY